MLLEVETVTGGIKFGGKIGESTAKRLVEISKEEKLTCDRLRDLRIGVAKKIKEVASTGVFQS